MATEVLNELKTFQTSLNERLDDVGQKVDRYNRRLTDVEEIVKRPVGVAGDGRGVEQKQLSGIVDTDEFKAFKRAGKGRVGWMLGTGFFPAEMKTTILSGDLGAGAIQAQRVPAIVKPGTEDRRVRDLIPRVECTSGSVDFLRELAWTNAASPQVEGSAKAESALTFELETMPVRTIAHWLPASRQVLDDLPQLRNYIDSRLLDGLRDVEDAQILFGNGTGQNLSGLTTQGTAYDTSANVVGDTNIDKLNHAIAQLEAEKLRATGIVLNPGTWRGIQLLKDSQERYLLGGPQVGMAPALWNVPVAVSTSMPVNQFIVLDGRRVALFDRMDARIELSTEHADYFTRNLVAIRAEERLALVVFLAEAVVYGAF